MVVSLPETNTVDYTIRPLVWDLQKVETYAPRFLKVGVFSDDIPQDVYGFLRYVLATKSLWWEIIRESTKESLGFIYLSDMMPSWTEKRYISAHMHAIVWDAKMAPLHPAGKGFILWAFKWFRLHKLYVAIPAKFGGSIRNAKKIGFREEARLREARRYNGVWFDVILLSLLEQEVAQWATPSALAYSGHPAQV